MEWQKIRMLLFEILNSAMLAGKVSLPFAERITGGTGQVSWCKFFFLNIENSVYF